MEERKQREKHYHDHLRGVDLPANLPKYTAYRKWYEAGNAGDQWLKEWLMANCPERRVLDYACGDGGLSIEIARLGAIVTGIDISDTSIEIAQKAAQESGVTVDFHAMDGESMGFPNATFDVIVCSGCLHHMDLHQAYPEIARVLKPGGAVLAVEALGHNAFINWYRRSTPHLRSPDEHPLLRQDIKLAKAYFQQVDLRFFSLLSLAAAPFHKKPGFRALRFTLIAGDSLLLRLPWVKWNAWMVGMLLRLPRSLEVAPEI